MMIALQIVLSRFLSITTPLIKMGFGFLPIAIVAMLYGPVYSGVAWGISDLIGALMFPVGPFFYGFTISAAINGLIYGLYIYKNHSKIWRIVAAVLTASVLVSLGVDTVWLTMLTGNPPMTVFLSRLLKTGIMAPVQIVTITLIGKRFQEFIYRNSTLALEKGKLRNRALGYFSGAFRNDRVSISESVAKNLFALPDYQKAKTIFCYVGKETEVDTARIIERALSDQKRVAIPLCAAKGIMTAREIKSLDGLEKGKFGVLEPPVDAPLVLPEEIDIALIPALISDAKGRRIGYGGGYYDRYLEKQAGIEKLVLCPSAMVEEKVPSAGFDLRADILITEQGTLNFN